MVGKLRSGDRIALLGGVDVDFITRSELGAVRDYARDILKVCVDGRELAFGVGNWVADFIPLDNYLAMPKEARRYA